MMTRELGSRSQTRAPTQHSFEQAVALALDTAIGALDVDRHRPSRRGTASGRRTSEVEGIVAGTRSSAGASADVTRDEHGGVLRLRVGHRRVCADGADARLARLDRVEAQVVEQRALNRRRGVAVALPQHVGRDREPRGLARRAARGAAARVAPQRVKLADVVELVRLDERGGVEREGDSHAHATVGCELSREANGRRAVERGSAAAREENVDGGARGERPVDLRRLHLHDERPGSRLDPRREVGQRRRVAVRHRDGGARVGGAHLPLARDADEAVLEDGRAGRGEARGEGELLLAVAGRIARGGDGWGRRGGAATEQLVQRVPLLGRGGREEVGRFPVRCVLFQRTAGRCSSRRGLRRLSRGLARRRRAAGRGELRREGDAVAHGGEGGRVRIMMRLPGGQLLRGSGGLARRGRFRLVLVVAVDALRGRLPEDGRLAEVRRVAGAPLLAPEVLGLAALLQAQALRHGRRLQLERRQRLERRLQHLVGRGGDQRVVLGGALLQLRIEARLDAADDLLDALAHGGVVVQVVELDEGGEQHRLGAVAHDGELGVERVELVHRLRPGHERDLVPELAEQQRGDAHQGLVDDVRADEGLVDGVDGMHLHVGGVDGNVHEALPDVVGDDVAALLNDSDEHVDVPRDVAAELLRENGDHQDEVLAEARVGVRQVLEQLPDDLRRVAGVAHGVQQVEGALAQRVIGVVQHGDDDGLVLGDLRRERRGLAVAARCVAGVEEGGAEAHAREQREADVAPVRVLAVVQQEPERVAAVVEEAGRHVPLDDEADDLGQHRHHAVAPDQQRVVPRRARRLRLLDRARRRTDDAGEHAADRLLLLH
mmetsp:Transcript_41340/g.127762  ORF Transcript_41340/g.127762 Transcript_41340/m.127762 type:complete len:832 (-) Transcript_41340:950-3445(-)